MAVHLSGKDKIVVIIIASALIIFMGVVAIMASCNYFEHFSMDHCAAGCLFKNLEAC